MSYTINLGILKEAVTESPPPTEGRMEYEELMKQLLRLKRPVVRSLRKYAKSRAVREEAFFEALVDRCIKGEAFEPESERAYLTGITKNKLIAKYRKDQLLKINLTDPIAILDHVSMDLTHIEVPEYILSCLKHLERRFPNRYIAIKGLMESLTIGEIMEMVGKEIKENTVNQWRKRGIDALKACIKKVRK